MPSKSERKKNTDAQHNNELTLNARTPDNMPTLNANMTTIAYTQRNKTDAFDAECLCSTDAECNNTDTE